MICTTVPPASEIRISSTNGFHMFITVVTYYDYMRRYSFDAVEVNGLHVPLCKRRVI